MSTQRIHTRLYACRCGCHGQDPWHKPHYDRVVRNIVEIPPTANPTDSAKEVIVATGTAAFPWGQERVVATVWSYDGKLQTVRTWQLETYKR